MSDFPVAVYEYEQIIAQFTCVEFAVKFADCMCTQAAPEDRLAYRVVPDDPDVQPI